MIITTNSSVVIKAHPHIALNKCVTHTPLKNCTTVVPFSHCSTEILQALNSILLCGLDFIEFFYSWHQFCRINPHTHIINNKALEEERIIGVETGGYPHTAIREDASMNLLAVDELCSKFKNLDFVFIESGGDNLSATFSPELSGLTIYVIDVSAGDKIPRKGGPGITKSDLLIINKTDLAPLVGASLEVMQRDAKKMRGERPFLFSNLKKEEGLAEIMQFIKDKGMLT